MLNNGLLGLGSSETVQVQPLLHLSPSMVESVLNRIYKRSQKSTFILITQWTTQAVRFTKALKLATQPPMRLLVSWNMIAELAGSGFLPITKKGAACRLQALRVERPKDGEFRWSFEQDHLHQGLHQQIPQSPLRQSRGEGSSGGLDSGTR